VQTDMFFYAAFLGQINVLSFHLPRKALDRVRYVFETYPPSEFPTSIRDRSRTTSGHSAFTEG
jgi:hypothetical protein